jgi:hypothetical protein
MSNIRDREIDLAIELGLPIIIVNLNNKTGMDGDLCPSKLRNACAVHIPFKLAAIRHALDRCQSNGASSMRQRGRGAREITRKTYRRNGSPKGE